MRIGTDNSLVTVQIRGQEKAPRDGQVRGVGGVKMLEGEARVFRLGRKLCKGMFFKTPRTVRGGG